MPDDQTKKELENLAAHGIGLATALFSLTGKALVGGITLAAKAADDLLAKVEENSANRKKDGKQ